MTQPHPDEKTHVAYTTFQPDVRQVFTEREYAELKAQGLIHKDGRAKDGDPAPEQPGAVQKPA